MLDPVHDYDTDYRVDAVDDPIVAQPGRQRPVALSDERLAESVRLLADRAPNSDEGSISDLGRNFVEITDTLGGDPDPVRHQGPGSGGGQR
jgi:hypothetical protein